MDSSKSARQKKGSPVLPVDLTNEILLRLPVKSLLRFTLGCRGWNTIIKSSKFKHDHCQRGSDFTSNLVHWQEFDYEEEEFGDEKVCSIFPDDGMLGRYEVPPLSGQSYDQSYYMYGACNGIICCKGEDDAIALWNPATRKLRQIPSCPIENFVVGFGSDPITNTLKIILINQYCQKRQFSVYNSTEDSWASFEDSVIFDPHFTVMNNCGRSFSNGIYYWMKTPRITSATGKPAILAFDMRNNSFQEMQMPKINFRRGEEAKFDFLDDTLALFIWKFSRDPMPVNMWLMKERGCWTKHKTVMVSSSLSAFGVWKGSQLYASKESGGCKELIVLDQDFRNSRSLGEIGFVTYIYRFKESLIGV